jgi:CubicO group peptidase (beta-lactamase class C family)
MRLKNRIAAALLLAFASIAIASAAGADADLADLAGAARPAAADPMPAFDLDADARQALKTFGVPGMAIAIVKDGRVLAARGYGVRRLGEHTPVDGKTLFEVASNSKAFTAAALAMLVDEGKLNWDDPVTEHLPGFRMYDAYASGAMTVRDLLVHRSGLGLGAGDLLWWPTTTFSADDIIGRLRYIKPATSFRSSYAYDNLLYIAAGKIVADKAGKPWGEAVRERILAPLGMDGTVTSVVQMRASGNYAAPHSRVGQRQTVVAPMLVENAAGAVGIDTSAEDMARWMNLLLAGGKLPDGRQLFSAERARELWTEYTPMKISEPPPALAATRPNFAGYGLGFNLRDYQGRKLVLHGGALQGFYSRVLMVPEEKLGIAILTNAENSPLMTALQWRILDHYLQVPARDWIRLYAEDEARNHGEELARQGQAVAARAQRSAPSLPLVAYDGEYRDPWYGSVTIREQGGRHVLSFSRSPDLTGELEHFQHDTFIVHWQARHLNADAYVTFALNPDGSIERMKMAPVSGETDFSFDFADLEFKPVKPPKAAKGKAGS